MEFRATFDNEISGPADEATASLEGMAAALGAADKALKALRGTANAPTATERAAEKAEKAATATAKAAEKAATATARAAEKTEKAATAEKKATAKAAEKAATATAKAAEKASKDEQKLLDKATKAKAAEHSKFADKVKSGANNIALASYAAAGAMLAYGMPLALGYKGMAKLQMIGAKASLDIRKLFTGVNPAPVLRAAERFTSMFSKSTATGRVLTDVVNRVFNGIFHGVEAAEPYVQAFVQGLIGGFLRGEQAILKARIALFPYTSMLSDATSGIDGLSVAARFGTIAFALLGAKAIWSAVSTSASFIGMGVRAVVSLGSVVVSAATATASMGTLAAATAAACLPYIAMAAAIVAVGLAISQASKLAKEWDSQSSSQMWTKLKSDVGITSDKEASAEMSKRQGMVTGAEYDKLHPELAAKPRGGAPPPGAAKAPPVPPAVTATAGQTAGEALGDGLVKGMASKEAAVGAAGASLAKAADAGVRTEAQIKSPSRKMRRNAGYMAEGAVLGFKDAESDVQEAAANALVPDVGKASPAGAGQAPRGAGGPSFTVNFYGPVAGPVADFEAAVRRVITGEVRDAALAMGVKVGTT